MCVYKYRAGLMLESRPGLWRKCTGPEAGVKLGDRTDRGEGWGKVLEGGGRAAAYRLLLEPVPDCILEKKQLAGTLCRVDG